MKTDDVVIFDDFVMGVSGVNLTNELKNLSLM